ncbi:MAG: peptidylprolyl isomerase, partial [bacterium]
MNRMNIVLRVLAVGLLLIAAALAILGCGGGVKKEVAVMQTDMGTVILGFYPDIASKTVARFKELAREGFYDGVLFHRVIPGFVVQSGDPKTKDPNTPPMEYGTGGSGQNLPAEFSELKHKRGTLAMARAQDPNSADSQFYIALEAQPHLDGKYTIFGEVLKGMDVIDRIAAVETDARDVPRQPIHILSIKIVSRKEAGL